jgi:hypothetical protein
VNPRLVAWLIGIGAVIAVAGMSRQIFSHDQSQRFQEVKNVGQSPSDIDLSLTVNYDTGRVAQEAYAMSDRDGRSNATYAVTDRNGTTARFHETIGGYGVSFLFERLVSDGIWELTSKPPRGDTSIHYLVTVKQTVGGQNGGRSVAFTDPHYWATTAGRQYRIHLDKNKPVPDLVGLQSTTIADPRYARVVTDFRDFGSPTFKATIVQARERLGLPP